MSSSDAGVSHFAPKITDREATGYDYFHREAPENNFTRSEYVIVKPLNALGNGPIWCEVGHEQSNYLVPLDNIEARLKLQILDEDGEALAAGVNGNASLINFAAERSLENINVKLMGESINDSHRLHPYKVGLIKHLSYGHMAKTYNLGVERFKEETSTTTTAVDSTCANYVDKVDLVDGSPVCHFNFMPLIDIASGNNWLCMGHKLFLEFERGKDNFVMLRKTGTSGTYKIKIIDFELQIKKLYPTDAFRQRLEKSLQTKPAVYSFTRNVLRTFAVHSGVKHIEWNNIFIGKETCIYYLYYSITCFFFLYIIIYLFIGQLPTALYFILLDNDQISGSIDTNPDTWLDYGCNRAHLIINGYTHPADSVRYDKSTKNIFNGYRWFLQNIGIGQSNDDVEISMDKYYKDKFVIPFDLSHRGDCGFMAQANENGTVSYRCEFSTATTKPLTLLVLASFDSNILVDKDKNVKMDYI